MLLPLTQFAPAFPCRDSLLYAFSLLFSRDVKPGTSLSTMQLHQLMHAALVLGLTDQYLQLLRWPDDSTIAVGPVKQERSSLLASAVLLDQPAVLAEMSTFRESDLTPRFDPNLTWVPTKSGPTDHETLLVHALRHCCTDTVVALLAGGADPNGDPGPGGLTVLGLDWRSWTELEGASLPSCRWDAGMLGPGMQGHARAPRACHLPARCLRPCLQRRARA